MDFMGKQIVYHAVLVICQRGSRLEEGEREVGGGYNLNYYSLG